MDVKVDRVLGEQNDVWWVWPMLGCGKECSGDGDGRIFVLWFVGYREAVARAL